MPTIPGPTHYEESYVRFPESELAAWRHETIPQNENGCTYLCVRQIEDPGHWGRGPGWARAGSSSDTEEETPISDTQQTTHVPGKH